MALACDQCRRVPAHSQRGEKWHWIKMEVPMGVILHNEQPPPYSGMAHGVATVTESMQFCDPACVASYILSAGQRISHVQNDSLEVMREHDAIRGTE
jgi:hypothetical protein